MTCTLDGHRWHMTACEACNGTGTIVRDFPDENYKTGLRPVLTSCRACDRRGYSRRFAGTVKTEAKL